MLLEQKTRHEIWMDFATRLIKHTYNATPERINKLLDQVTGFIEVFKDTEIVGWDHEHEEEGYICDAVSESFDEYKVINIHGEQVGKFYNQICCAIRAGLDVALPEQASSGVIGFTVGDLRRMYPEGLPLYVRTFFDPPLSDEAEDGEAVWL
jgi:hypothetical protein